MGGSQKEIVTEKLLKKVKVPQNKKEKNALILLQKSTYKSRQNKCQRTSMTLSFRGNFEKGAHFGNPAFFFNDFAIAALLYLKRIQILLYVNILSITILRTCLNLMYLHSIPLKTFKY